MANSMEKPIAWGKAWPIAWVTGTAFGWTAGDFRIISLDVIDCTTVTVGNVLWEAIMIQTSVSTAIQCNAMQCTLELIRRSLNLGSPHLQKSKVLT